MKAEMYEIKIARFALGWTQKDLARESKVCLSVIIKAEGGKDISPRSNRAIRNALGLK